MNTHGVHLVRPVTALLCAASLSSLSALTACGGGDGGGSNPTPTLTMSGTAATGIALNGAAMSVSCLSGTASATADANGNYSLTVTGRPPCIISATANGMTLHSVAFAGGTFNTTPETDLLLTFLAAQLGTTETGLIAGLSGNTRFQQVLANSTDVMSAQSAVVTNLQQRYALTLSAPNFLTTAFATGKPGVDSDLEALRNAGAIDSNGQPDPAAVSLMMTAGAAQAFAVPPPSTGGTGTGNTGSGGIGVGMM
jgi:hypothetical protein